MDDPICDPMVVVSSDAELPDTQRVWGTGGWLPPEQREALDWLTLSRLLGWGVKVIRRTNSEISPKITRGARCIIIAVDPDTINEEMASFLTSILAVEPILVVARAGAGDKALAHLAGASRKPEGIKGRSVTWNGPGQERIWHFRKTLDFNTLKVSDETSSWATLDGAPLIVARRVGRGTIVTMGFHPSEARDLDGHMTALLKHLLIYGSPAPIAWIDFAAVMILRMDDPGGAQNVYNRNWCYPKLSKTDWAAIRADLKRRDARLSIGYVAGWVDDGDAKRGLLKIAGRRIGRIPGRVYPSPQVKYEDLGGHAPGTLYDYESEFIGIQALRAESLAEVELHGYTHMHPDTVSWANAPDRYGMWPATSWYRELGKVAEKAISSRTPDQHPLELGTSALRKHFGILPTTLICPGDDWTNKVLERALGLGLRLVSSYYLALRDGDRFCWSMHVCAPYLDVPDAAWFDAELPVVGYFHDYEPALDGVGWIRKWLDRWHEAGARKFMDFRELAAAIGRHLYLEERDDGLHLTVTSDGAPGLVRPVAVNIHLPAKSLPSRLSVTFDDRNLSLKVDPLENGVGRVVLPHSSDIRAGWSQCEKPRH